MVLLSCFSVTIDTLDSTDQYNIAMVIALIADRHISYVSPELYIGCGP